MAHGNKNSKTQNRDILPKVLSILAAFILWFYVVDLRTTIEEKTISGIPVTIVNFDSETNLDVISGREHTVEVTVSGIKNDVESISQDDIVVTADMNGIVSSGTYKIDLNVTTPSGISIVKKSTSEISVTVDKTTSKHFPIEVKYRSTDVDASVYEIGDPILSVDSIQITGPQKVVDSIEKMLVTLNMDVIKDTIDSKGCTVVPVDTKGNAVSSPYIKLNQSAVDVLIPVYKAADVEILPVYSDELNYTISYTDFSPKIVTVKGKVEAVNSIDCIFTETIDVAASSGVLNVNLNLPDGITAYNKDGSPVHSVRINGFSAEPIALPFDEVDEEFAEENE